jgi:hypothetical protein
MGSPGLLRRLRLLSFAAWSWSMTIRLRPSEPGLEDDLALFLRRHECRAEVDENGRVIVELPHLIHQEQARMELELYIRLWQALHGISVRIDLLDEASSSS